MNTKTVKKPVAFRFDENLLNKLKINAKKEHRSLNNYVESLLIETVYNEPNDETIKAMEEVLSGKTAGKVDTSSLKSFLKSFE